MDLNTIWFVLVTVLFIGFFFLEGFDYGVGILLPFIAKDDKHRRLVINTIGPFWDGNEVWLLTAGGAIFAAFPHWYATLFSGFYLALVLMLLALIVRGVAFEFRSKSDNPTWRATWDWMIFVGSFVPALLWGVAVANLIRGVPIDEEMNYVGGFFNLLNPFALVGGVVFVLLFSLHGAIFLSLKTTDAMQQLARKVSLGLWLPTVIAVVALVVYGYLDTDMFGPKPISPYICPVIAALALLACGWFMKQNKCGWGFIMTGLTITFATIMVFVGLFPRVMVSSLDNAWSLTIYNASSSPYTLKIMTTVALICTPIVLLYQAWTYWIFRKRVSLDSEMEY